MGFTKPNHTQVPNELFDVLLPSLQEAELKVTLCLIRKILGFHKDKPEPVSLSQIQDMTGLSRQGAMDGLETAIKRGTIRRVGNGKRNIGLYEIVHNDQSNGLTSEGNDQSNDLTSSSLANRPVTGLANRHTKEKGKILSKETIDLYKGLAPFITRMMFLSSPEDETKLTSVQYAQGTKMAKSLLEFELYPSEDECKLIWAWWIKTHKAGYTCPRNHADFHLMIQNYRKAARPIPQPQLGQAQQDREDNSQALVDMFLANLGTKAGGKNGNS